MSGISSKAAGGLENKYKYNGKEEQRKEFSDGSGLEWLDYGARMYDAQIGRWHVQDIMIERHFNSSPYTYVHNNPIKSSDQFGLDTVLVDKKGNFSKDKLKGGENDVIVKVSKSEREKGAIDYNKKGKLKNSHKVSQAFEKESINVTQSKEGASINTSNAQSENVFNFLVDNTEVEFAFIKYSENGETKNTITTSYLEDQEPFGSNIVTKFIENGIKILSHTHSHPGISDSGPSSMGNSAVDGASGDMEAYKFWTRKQGTSLKIYIRHDGITREFDLKGNEVKTDKK
jgi:RHS repeat-associated protein